MHWISRLMKWIHVEIWGYQHSNAHYTGIVTGSYNYESNNYVVAIGRVAKMSLLRALWQFCNRQELVVYMVLLVYLILELLCERRSE